MFKPFHFCFREAILIKVSQEVMPVFLTDTQLSGRATLLSWINSVCSTQYPSVVSLRDGVAYCIIVDAASRHVAENCSGLAIPGVAAFRSRSRRSSQLLGRLDWDITQVTCANQDPSLDCLQDRAQCERNLQILQKMLYECLPREFSLEVDVPRLAAGKLQDHVQLLRRMQHNVNRLLTAFSRTTLERRLRSTDGSGCVEGVKMTRAMLLQRRAAQKQLRRPTPRRNDKEDIDTHDHGQRYVEAESGSEVNRKGDCGMRPPVAPSEHVSPAQVSPGSQPSCGIGPRMERASEGYFIQPTSYNGFKTTGGSSVVVKRPRDFSHASRGMFHEFLGELVRDIELYETLVLASQGRHQRCLLGCGEGKGEDVGAMEPHIVDVLPKEAPIICLEKLGLLSEKRDKLWQTLSVIQNTIIRFASNMSEEDWDSMSAAPLIKTIKSVLSIQ
uniref:WGS project CAEQ00000000 data, annotated contig 1708 n=1 Tax=Trypanosoma congolense (strain IL3000) TaxID=1068625 RepID=F9W855_TRYCI|nr:unnamed protein product [Trypanosoma congolense IL3000]